MQDSVKSSEQLKNVAAPRSIAEVVDFSSLNYDISQNGLTTKLSLDSKQLNQVIKLSTKEDDQTAQDMAFSIEKEQVRIQSSVQLGFISSKEDIYASPKVEGDKLEFEVDSVHLGNLPLLKSLVMNQIKERLNQGDNSEISVEGNSIRLPLTLSYVKIQQIKATDGKLDLTLTLDSSLLSNLSSLLTSNN